MNEHLFEPFLAQYYLLEAICRPYMTEAEEERAYFELASVFCIDGSDEVQYLYGQSHLPYFYAINDLVSYGRLCRTVEFATDRGQELDITPTDTLILSCKRQAMTVKAALFKQDRNLTRETVAQTLLIAANNGSVDATALLAFMEYHGIGVCMDRASALKRIRLCARWNSLFGNLMGIAYDEGNVDSYLSVIGTVSMSEGQKQAFEQICRAIDRPTEFRRNAVARLLERAFGQGNVKRNLYDRAFARIAFSDLISTEDKAKLLLGNGDNVRALADLPFDAKKGVRGEFDATALDGLPVNRAKENNRIACSFAIAKACSPTVYKPLLVVCDDEFVYGAYGEALAKAMKTLPTVTLDGGVMSEKDFEGSAYNALLRGVSETGRAATYFVIKDCHELDNRSLDELVKLIDNAYRGKLKLFSPAVSFDLSETRLVLLCLGRSPQACRLAEVCDTVIVDGIRRDERASVVESCFRRRANEFGTLETVINTDARDRLATLTSRQLSTVIDGLLRRAVMGGNRVITDEDVLTVCREEEATPIRRGFGYVGGITNA